VNEFEDTETMSTPGTRMQSDDLNDSSLNSIDDMDDEDLDDENEEALDAAAQAEEEAELASIHSHAVLLGQDEDDDMNLDEIENILELSEEKFPRFTLAKNKARFLRMVSWYRGKEEWIEVAPLSGVTKLFKQQTKELEGIRSSKLDYEMELETGTLTPSQRSYRRDELKMCKVQEKMAVHLISKLQVKIKSGRR
jgi:hypothetical protein